MRAATSTTRACHDTALGAAAQGVFAAPYPDMPHKVALATWARLDIFADFDEDRINPFVSAWVGNADNAQQ
jgi:hypothetical protein